MRVLKPILFAALFSFLFISCKKDKNIEPIQKTIISYNNIKIGNQNNQLGCFINLSTGKVYQFDEAFEKQNEIDLIFLHDFAYGALISPAWVYNNYPSSSVFLNPGTGVKFWNALRTTDLDICESSVPNDFTSVLNFTQLETLYNQCGMVMGVAEHDVKKDQIIRFKTADNKIGVIKINKVQGNENIDGFIELEIKIQK